MCQTSSFFTFSGNTLSILTSIGETTAVNKLSFLLTYEFVTLAQDGEVAQPVAKVAAHAGAAAQPWETARPEETARPGDSPSVRCDRIFRSHEAGGHIPGDGQPRPFGSPTNVFLFGRGGRTNLTCTYLFYGGDSQRIRLTILNVSLGGGDHDLDLERRRPSCRTVHDPELGRYRCDYHHHGLANQDGRIGRGVFVSEVSGEPLSRSQCFCQYMPGAAVTSTANVIQVTFHVPDMDAGEDAAGLFFRGTFQFIDKHAAAGRCTSGGNSLVTTDDREGAGLVTLDESRGCEGVGAAAWSRRTGPTQRLLVRVPGLLLPQPYAGVPACPLKSRLVITTAGLTSVICPLGGSDPVQISAPYSPLPSNASQSGYLEEEPGELQTILIRLMGPASEPPVRLSWLEYSLDPTPPAALTGLPLAACETACPGLGCIAPGLWCDGVPDCPGGQDEAEAACSAVHLFSLRLLLLGLAAGGAAVFLSLVVLLAARLRMRIQQRADRRLKHEESILKRTSNGTVETMLNHKVFVPPKNLFPKTIMFVL
jgi:hypothetical protein